MIRRWTVRPDEELYLTNGETLYICSDEACDAALLEAGRIQKRIGGYVSAGTQRVPTEVPGEMVTTLLVIEWRDRTDAKPQPEAPSTVAEPIPGQTSLDEALEPEQTGEPDGFDYSQLEAEDAEEPTPAR